MTYGSKQVAVDKAVNTPRVVLTRLVHVITSQGVHIDQTLAIFVRQARMLKTRTHGSHISHTFIVEASQRVVG